MFDAQEEIPRPIYYILLTYVQHGLLRLSRQTVAVLHVELGADEALWVDQLLHIREFSNGDKVRVGGVVFVNVVPVEVEDHGPIINRNLQQILVYLLLLRVVELPLVPLREVS